ncbi:MAG: SH3 domain-containing protein [Blastocatellales bacterium]
MKRFLSCVRLYFHPVIILSLPVFLAACSQDPLADNKAFVVPERLKLKSSTAQAARVVGELKSGDHVTITDRANAEDGDNWSQVKGPNGEEGWIESRYLVKQEIVEKSRKIADEIKDVPTQAIGKSKATLKLRLSPDRGNEDNVATALPSGTMLEIVGRERKPRPAAIESKSEAKEDSDRNVRYDDWYQVRLKDYAILRAGWIYGGSVELEVPPEIIYFVSTGRRITGWQKIGTVRGDDSKSGDHFLVLERRNSGADEGVDFDRIKVLAYDPATRNYSTPFREDITGRFPVTLKMAGTRGRFQIVAVNKNGQEQKLTYEVEMLEGGRVRVTKPPKN